MGYWEKRRKDLPNYEGSFILIKKKRKMIVQCKQCNQLYERFNVGDYGYPYLCNKCKKKTLKGGNKKK